MNRLGRIWAAVVLGFFAVNISAEPVLIKGKARSYASQKLEFVQSC